MPAGRPRGRWGDAPRASVDGRPAVPSVAERRVVNLDADALHRFVAESRRCQGLPERVSDPGAIAQLALLLRTTPAGRGEEGRPGAGPRAL